MAGAIPKGYEGSNVPSDIWRVGMLFTWAEGFTPPTWVNEVTFITIKPGETGVSAYRREFGHDIPASDFVFIRP